MRGPDDSDIFPAMFESESVLLLPVEESPVVESEADPCHTAPGWGHLAVLVLTVKVLSLFTGAIFVLGRLEELLVVDM